MKILMIDDHALFRDGLKALFEHRGISVVAAIGDGGNITDLLTDLVPDIVLLDLRMPHIHGLEVLQNIHQQHPQLAVVILTTSNDKHDLADSLKMGAKGYLLKDMDPDDLVNALKKILIGETVVAPELTNLLAEVIQQSAGLSPSAHTAFNTLTPREKEILCHLTEGQSNKAIARRLDISDGTVKLHVKAVLKKLNVHSRVEAAVIAIETKVCRQHRA